MKRRFDQGFRISYESQAALGAQILKELKYKERKYNLYTENKVVQKDIPCFYEIDVSGY